MLIFSQHIFLMFLNETVRIGKFSAILKNGDITAVFKKGFKRSKENYRPVSILPIISKIFEKIITLRSKLFTRQIFAIFANFCQICEIKCSRKIHWQPTREINSKRKKNSFFGFSELAKLTFLHQVLYQLTIVMSKIFYRVLNNISRDNIEKKKVNIFIIYAPFDLLLGIQSRIKYFIFK